MRDANTALSPFMRTVLMACGPMNLIGAVSFSPPVTVARRAIQLPEPDAFYLWVISSWVLAFGAAYFHQGWTGQANRSVLALGAWGKAVFAGLLIAKSIRDEMPVIAGLAGLPDLVLALVFVGWLVRTRNA